MRDQALRVAGGAQAGAPAPLLPILAILGSIVSLTVGASLAKQVFPVVGAQGTVALRLGFAALVLCAIRRPWRRRMTAADLRVIVLFGGILGLMNFCFYMALRTIPMGVAIAIEFIGPLSVAVASSRRAIDFGWVACATFGLALLLPLRQGAAGLDPVGVAYALCAAVFWGLYVVVGTSPRVGGLHGGQAVSLGMAVGACLVLPIGVAHAGAALLTPTVLMFGLGVAVLSSAIPYSLEMVALRLLPRETFGILLSLEPAVGALAAFVILGERLAVSQWLAIGFIILASAGSAVTGRRSLPVVPSEP
jgi:inner membrane transporter RhtA